VVLDLFPGWSRDDGVDGPTRAMVAFDGGAMNDSNARHNHLGQPVGFRVSGWTPRLAPPRTPMLGRFARIEPLDADRHAAELFEANSEDREGRNWTYYNYGPFATLADYRKWVEDSSADKARIIHAIIDLGSGKAVGVAAYANIQPVHDDRGRWAQFQPAPAAPAGG